MVEGRCANKQKNFEYPLKNLKIQFFSFFKGFFQEGHRISKIIALPALIFCTRGFSGMENPKKFFNFDLRGVKKASKIDFPKMASNFLCSGVFGYGEHESEGIFQF
jgi:hypothetical protein